MEFKRTIIKGRAVTVDVSKGAGEPPAEERPLRIPAGQAQHLVTLAEEELEDAFRLRGILRGGEAPAPVVRYEMADLSLEPDFPLPEPAPTAMPEPTAPVVDEEPDLEQDPFLEAEWQQRLEEAVEQARKEAYEEGYEEGYVAAEAALQASFDQRKVELEKDVARLQAAWREFLKKSEPLMASLAFEIVRQLLGAPLPQDVKAVSVQALSNALDQFGEDTPIEITLHPDDYSRLQAYGLTDDLEALHSSIRWNAEETIAMGDWIVQSPDSAIRRLKEEMLGHLKSRLGLLAIMKARDS